MINVDKLGHAHSCYINPRSCASKFLSIEILSPHFPKIRLIKRQFYNIHNLDQKLRDLDEALNSKDIEKLLQISDQAQSHAQAFSSNCAEIDLNENNIRSKFTFAFRAYTKRVIDPPLIACISCEKLCCKKNIHLIDVSRNISYGSMWAKLMDLVCKRLERDDIYSICRYCRDKFRKNEMPPTCILNELEVLPVPPEILNLNIYEQILIQRAKAFQVVQKMPPVSNKNMPHRYKVPKIKGRTFHLPLPLDETLRKLCPPSLAINPHHELFILVRGIPTISKVVWERLVNLQKVWCALNWLKYHNPIYRDIELPKSYKDLLPDNLSEVQFQDQQINPSSDQGVNDLNLNCMNATNNKEQKPYLDIDVEKKSALLTQMSQSDVYYEQFTIYPIHEKRINATATDLYQMLKINDVPLDNRVKDLDAKCFPDLYPYGINGQHATRPTRITDFEFIKTKLMSKHPQFRMNIQYIFYLLNNNNIRQLNAGIFHKMNITKAPEKYSASTYLESMSKNQLETNLTTIFSRLRNTEQYWKIPRNNVKCMARHYGPATWFLTISPSEWLWSDLIEYLRDIHKVPENVTMNPNELIVSDPVSVSRFIDTKFRAMLDFILSPDHPIGEVEHYFYRREYQARGAQHFHLLIWIKDAPIIGKDSTQDIASFIMRYVTCRMPDKNVSPQLYRRVSTHQRHFHNSYCLRNKKTKTGFTRRCKFGHPRPLTDTFKIRDVIVSIAGRRRLKSKSRLYDLPRSTSEAYINDYNPSILCVWEGNMDIQFVGEISTILTDYTTKYSTKSEKANLNEQFDIKNTTKSARSLLWNLGLRSLNNRECGAFEAADSLLGIPLHGTDPWTTIRWLDVSPHRNRKLKTHKEISLLDEKSTDIFCPALIDTYYPKRPEDLDSLSLYDFARLYDITKKMPKVCLDFYEIDKSTYLKMRLRPCLINHYMFSVHTQPENYYFSILLLFKAWRDIESLKNGFETYADAFFSLRFQLVDALHYHERFEEIKRAIDHLEEQVQKKLEDDSNQTASPHNEDKDEVLECVPIEVQDAMKDLKVIGDNLNIEELTQMKDERNERNESLIKLLPG